ncbi:MAG: hypothetical protein ABL973_02885 [Micropepsaceae bacterium]
MRRLLSLLAFVFFAEICAAAAADITPQLINLGPGFSFEFLRAGETAARAAHPKTLFVSVSSVDRKIFSDKVRLVEGADRVFESVLLNPAEKGFYTSAIVYVKRPDQTNFEQFTYKRGDRGVWLRQAGELPWKVAQSNNWTPPASQKVELTGLGTLLVESAVDLPPQSGFRRSAEIDCVSKTSIVNLQQKYREIKALWSHLDRTKLKSSGYDLIMIGNFSSPQLGRFYLRKGFFVRIPLQSNGEWASLPDSLPVAQDALISQNEVAADAVTRDIRLAFSGGLETLRLTSVLNPATGPMAQLHESLVAFAEGTPVIRIDPVILVPSLQ